MFVNLKKRTYSAIFTLSISTIVLGLQLGCTLPVTFPTRTEERAYLLDRALAVNAMKRGDLSIRSDLSANPFALSSFSRWIENPIKAPVEAQQKAMKLLESAERPSLWLQELAKLGEIYSAMPLPLKRYTGYRLPVELSTQLRDASRLILDSIYTANMRLAAIRGRISPEKMKLFEKYLYPDGCSEGEPEKEEEELSRIRELEYSIDAAGDVDRRGILEAGLTIIKALSEAKELLMEMNNRQKNISSFSFRTDLGLVEIGGAVSDVHEKPATLIIDLGGNDLYKGKIASGADGKCSIVLDLGGDDVYLGEDFTQASGVWGIGVLFDLKGDDLYRAGNCSQGAGLFGIGLLMDGGGMDSYLGAKFVQAASSWGWGGLIDLSDEDIYQCYHSGQAYSGVLGVSCLCDLSGNDKYISGSNAPDPREVDMNQSFSQGFAFGMRNLAAGGFALLADKSGNDIYQCQYFGQGASYWMGVGILYDEYGKDIYIARRYAQGAGIHFSLGLLMDAGGNDHTYSWAVSQGCGHDYGIGILVNEAGNDTYVSEWLSMGASEANGVGIFVDNSGDDGYETKTGMAVGHLTEKRRAGGIGLFMDAGGKDRYSNEGCDNSVWGANRWGIGIDDEGGISGMNILSIEAKPAIKEGSENRRIKEKRSLEWMLERSEKMSYPLNIEAMISVASHWGLEGKIPREAQKKLLDLNPEKSVPAIVNLLDTPDIMVLIFMNRFFRVHAFHAVPELIRKKGDPDSLIKARAFYHLGSLKDSRALESCVEALNNPSWRVKSSAIRAIGEILDKRRLENLVPMREVFVEASKKREPGIIKGYIEEDEKRLMVLSVLARAIPINYQTYLRYAEIPSGEEKEGILKDYAHFISDHLDEMAPLVERWIIDINRSGHIAGELTNYLNVPDPAVKSATAYSLGQMNYRPAIPRLLSLLNDPHLWVRDAAVLSLALFGDEAIHPIGLAMKKGQSSFKILALDVLARIQGNDSKAIIEKYIDDPNQNIRRAAGHAMSKFRHLI